jgi:Sortase (surface protein transpeptidase)
VASLRTLASTWSRLTILAIAMALLVGSVATEPPARTVALPATPARTERHRFLWAPAIPAALTPADLSLRAGPVAVPLQLRMPTLGVNAEILGVGIASNNAMDAPKGPADDPVWDRAFWYRGSAIPGALSTALLAGHIDGPAGRQAVFGHLDRLRAGDPIVVHDTRTGLDVHFSVTAVEDYPLDQASDPAVLARIYGAGPVAGTWPQPSADHLAHLTLITCSGTFRNGTHDHRLAVYAVRTN